MKVFQKLDWKKIVLQAWAHREKTVIRHEVDATDKQIDRLVDEIQSVTKTT
jgi:hypothetical protein